jgi:glc operon protein GlcG
MKQILLALFALLVLAPAAAAQQLPSVPFLTLDAAKRIGAAAEAEARRNGWNVAIAVVDVGGDLVYFQRLDETQPASLEIAMRKARTSAAFKRPTKVFEDAVAGGRMALLSIETIIPIEGGLPVTVNGRVIGAIGVSGVTAQQDGVIAQAGIAALAQ